MAGHLPLPHQIARNHASQNQNPNQEGACVTSQYQDKKSRSGLLSKNVLPEGQ